MASKYDTSENYKAITRIKHDDEYLERGEDVDLDEDTMQELLDAEAITTEEEYDRLFPVAEEPTNEAWGTPSNLSDTSGTGLEAPTAEELAAQADDEDEDNGVDDEDVENTTTPGGNA